MWFVYSPLLGWGYLGFGCVGLHDVVSEVIYRIGFWVLGPKEKGCSGKSCDVVYWGAFWGGFGLLWGDLFAFGMRRFGYARTS